MIFVVVDTVEYCEFHWVRRQRKHSDRVLHFCQCFVWRKSHSLQFMPPVISYNFKHIRMFSYDWSEHGPADLSVLCGFRFLAIESVCTWTSHLHSSCRIQPVTYADCLMLDLIHWSWIQSSSDANRNSVNAVILTHTHSERNMTKNFGFLSVRKTAGIDHMKSNAWTCGWSKLTITLIIRLLASRILVDIVPYRKWREA